MYCSNCGFKNQDDAVYCEGCGSKLEVFQKEPVSTPTDKPEYQPPVDTPIQNVPVQDSADISYQQPVFAEENSSQPKSQKNISKIVIPAVAGVLAVVIIVTACVFVFKNKKNNVDSDSYVTTENNTSYQTTAPIAQNTNDTYNGDVIETAIKNFRSSSFNGLMRFDCDKYGNLYYTESDLTGHIVLHKIDNNGLDKVILDDTIYRDYDVLYYCFSGSAINVACYSDSEGYSSYTYNYEEDEFHCISFGDSDKDYVGYYMSDGGEAYYYYNVEPLDSSDSYEVIKTHRQTSDIYGSFTSNRPLTGISNIKGTVVTESYIGTEYYLNFPYDGFDEVLADSYCYDASKIYFCKGSEIKSLDPKTGKIKSIKNCPDSSRHPILHCVRDGYIYVSDWDGSDSIIKLELN